MGWRGRFSSAGKSAHLVLKASWPCLNFLPEGRATEREPRSLGREGEMTQRRGGLQGGAGLEKGGMGGRKKENGKATRGRF